MAASLFCIIIKKLISDDIAELAAISQSESVKKDEKQIVG